VPVDAGEPHAANALRFAGRVIYPAHHPRTRRRLHAGGLSLECLDYDELAKAEGGVTCCSLLVA